MKEVHTQARIAGEVIHDRRMKGKYYARDAMRIAMLEVDHRSSVGTPAEIRQQIIGAKGWARYRYFSGGKEAKQDQTIDWTDSEESTSC